jgi:hypothetical protein
MVATDMALTCWGVSGRCTHMHVPIRLMCHSACVCPRSTNQLSAIVTTVTTFSPNRLSHTIRTRATTQLKYPFARNVLAACANAMHLIVNPTLTPTLFAMRSLMQTMVAGWWRRRE